MSNTQRQGPPGRYGLNTPRRPSGRYGLIMTPCSYVDGADGDEAKGIMSDSVRGRGGDDVHKSTTAAGTASRHNTKSFASPGGTSNAVPAKLEASSYGMLEYEEVGHQKQLAVLICSVVGLFWGLVSSCFQDNIMLALCQLFLVWWPLWRHVCLRLDSMSGRGDSEAGVARHIRVGIMWMLIIAMYELGLHFLPVVRPVLQVWIVLSCAPMPSIIAKRYQWTPFGLLSREAPAPIEWSNRHSILRHAIKDIRQLWAFRSKLILELVCFLPSVMQVLGWIATLLTAVIGSCLASDVISSHPRLRHFRHLVFRYEFHVERVLWYPVFLGWVTIWVSFCLCREVVIHTRFIYGRLERKPPFTRWRDLGEDLLDEFAKARFQCNRRSCLWIVILCIVRCLGLSSGIDQRMAVLMPIMGFDIQKVLLLMAWQDHNIGHIYLEVTLGFCFVLIDHCKVRIALYPDPTLPPFSNPFDFCCKVWQGIAELAKSKTFAQHRRDRNLSCMESWLFRTIAPYCLDGDDPLAKRLVAEAMEPHVNGKIDDALLADLSERVSMTLHKDYGRINKWTRVNGDREKHRLLAALQVERSAERKQKENSRDSLRSEAPRKPLVLAGRRRRRENKDAFVALRRDSPRRTNTTNVQLKEDDDDQWNYRAIERPVILSAQQLEDARIDAEIAAFLEPDTDDDLDGGFRPHNDLQASESRREFAEQKHGSGSSPCPMEWSPAPDSTAFAHVEISRSSSVANPTSRDQAKSFTVKGKAAQTTTPTATVPTNLHKSGLGSLTLPLDADICVSPSTTPISTPPSNWLSYGLSESTTPFDIFGEEDSYGEELNDSEVLSKIDHGGDDRWALNPATPGSPTPCPPGIRTIDTHIVVKRRIEQSAAISDSPLAHRARPSADFHTSTPFSASPLATESPILDDPATYQGEPVEDEQDVVKDILKVQQATATPEPTQAATSTPPLSVFSKTFFLPIPPTPRWAPLDSLSPSPAWRPAPPSDASHVAKVNDRTIQNENNVKADETTASDATSTPERPVPEQSSATVNGDASSDEWDMFQQGGSQQGSFISGLFGTRSTDQSGASPVQLPPHSSKGKSSFNHSSMPPTPSMTDWVAHECKMGRLPHFNSTMGAWSDQVTRYNSLVWDTDLHWKFWSEGGVVAPTEDPELLEQEEYERPATPPSLPTFPPLFGAWLSQEHYMGRVPVDMDLDCPAHLSWARQRYDSFCSNPNYVWPFWEEAAAACPEMNSPERKKLEELIMEEFNRGADDNGMEAADDEVRMDGEHEQTPTAIIGTPEEDQMDLEGETEEGPVGVEPAFGPDQMDFQHEHPPCTPLHAPPYHQIDFEHHQDIQPHQQQPTELDQEHQVEMELDQPLAFEPDQHHKLPSSWIKQLVRKSIVSKREGAIDVSMNSVDECEAMVVQEEAIAHHSDAILSPSSSNEFKSDHEMDSIDFKVDVMQPAVQFLEWRGADFEAEQKRILRQLDQDSYSGQSLVNEDDHEMNDVFNTAASVAPSPVRKVDPFEIDHKRIGAILDQDSRNYRSLGFNTDDDIVHDWYDATVPTPRTPEEKINHYEIEQKRILERLDEDTILNQSMRSLGLGADHEMHTWDDTTENVPSMAQAPLKKSMAAERRQ